MRAKEVSNYREGGENSYPKEKQEAFTSKSSEWHNEHSPSDLHVFYLSSQRYDFCSYARYTLMSFVIFSAEFPAHQPVSSSPLNSSYRSLFQHNY